MSLSPFLGLLILSFLVEEGKNTFNDERGFDALGKCLKSEVRKWQTFSSELEQHAQKKTYKPCFLDVVFSVSSEQWP